MTMTNHVILERQKQKLRIEMSLQRLLISRQLTPQTDPSAVYPRSITMRLLQARPDVALHLLGKLALLVAGKPGLKTRPLVSGLLNILPLLVTLFPLLVSAVSNQTSNQNSNQNQTRNTDGDE